MNMFETIAWMALGFAPVMAAMEAAWRLNHKAVEVLA
jgi:hypothetical protein